MILRDYQQGSMEWRRWRQEGLTASDAVKLAGYWDGPAAVYAGKTGPLMPEVTNEAMRRGLELEPIARKYVEQELGINLLPRCGEYTHWPILRASFDGIGYDFDHLEQPDLVVEIKCPTSKKWHQANEIPEYYQPQLLHQVTVAQAESVVFVSYHPECVPVLRFHTVKFSLAQREAHITRCMRFWEDHVLARVPPPAAEKGEERQDTAWHALAAEYIRWNARKGEAEKKLEATRLALIEAMGPTERVRGGGVSLVRSTRAGGTDYATLVRDVLGEDADLTQWKKPPIEVVRVVVE